MVACEAIYHDIEPPDIEPVIVVNSFFENDKKIEVNISGSKSRFDNNNLVPIFDAKPYLFCDNELVDTLRINENPYFSDLLARWTYVSDIEPVKNKTYSIDIKADGYKTVRAEGQIPQNGSIRYIDHEFVAKGKYTTDKYLRVNLELNNIDKEGFYNISFSLREGIEETGYGYDYTLFDIEDPLIGTMTRALHSDYLIFKGNLFPQNGYKFSIDIKHEDWIYLYDGDVLVFELISLSEDVYKYLSTLTMHKNVDLRISDPIKVYTNVQGGYGIFGGINVVKDSLVWKEK
jgi:hypothetical protein